MDGWILRLEWDEAIHMRAPPDPAANRAIAQISPPEAECTQRELTD